MIRNLLICLFLFIWSHARAQVSQLAITPPMGWNSYNCYGSAVHESEVKANAAYMAKNLKAFGWKYVVVDYCWSYPNPPGSTLNNVPQFRLRDGSYVPWLNMDRYGRLLPDEQKFPSSRGGVGFKPLADYIHSLGLKFGIHIMRGIPRQAVWAKTRVKGTGLDASMVADTNSTCTWINHMYGLKAESAQAYYNSLTELYAQWGVDLIKMDDMTSDTLDRPYYRAEVEAIRKAIAHCARPIVLSISPYQDRKNADHLMANANMFRISEDFWDTWRQLKEQFDFCSAWAGLGVPGHWPDADMLQIGKISKRGPKGPERFSRLTPDEQLTHMTLWCMFRAPLMMGGNLPENTPFVTQLLTNKDVLDIDQHSVASRQLYRRDDKVVWISRMPDSTVWNVAFFNLADTSQLIELPFKDIGLKGKWTVKNLWHPSRPLLVRTTFRVKVNPHGTALFRFIPPKERN